MMSEWMDLKTYHDHVAIIRLLSDCMYADEEAILRELIEYQRMESRRLYGKGDAGELIGLIGIEHHSECVAELRHIAVRSDYRGCGIGRDMIMNYIRDDKIQILNAETDRDAVHFYEKIGFHIVSLGEKYPGVERFQCVFYAEQQPGRSM